MIDWISLSDGGTVKSVKAPLNFIRRFIAYCINENKHLQSGDLQIICRRIVEPQFSYCYFVWGCCSETKVNSLQRSKTELQE